MLFSRLIMLLGLMAPSLVFAHSGHEDEGFWFQLFNMEHTTANTAVLLLVAGFLVTVVVFKKQQIKKRLKTNNSK